MINRKTLVELMDNGSIPYVYAPERGRIAVTEEILLDCSRLSGDEISNEAARALIQIYEAQLLRLAERLAALYPS